jgi:DNA-binding beta-propeller fold protein YncE
VVTIDGIDGTVDPLVLDVELGRAPVVGFSLHDYYDADAIIAQFYDQSTHSFVPTLPKSAGSSNSGDYHRSACGSAIISADNRWFYCGSSHSASVKIYDMAQMGASLTPTVVEVPIHRDLTVDTLEELSIVGDTTALVRGLALSPDDQTLYASVGYAGYGGDLDAARADGLDVIRIDVSDPTAPVADTAARVVLDNADSEASSFGLALSPNGKQLAVGGFALSTVHFIDTASMTQIDTDASLPGTQPLDFGAGRDPMHMVWRGNGSLVVADDGWSQHRLVAVDVQGGYAMDVFLEGPGGSPTALHFDADGRLWELLGNRGSLVGALWAHEYVPGILPQGNQTVSSPVSFLKDGAEAWNGLGLWLSSDHNRVIGATDGNNAVAREFGADDLAAIPGLSEAAAPYVSGGRDSDGGHWTTGTSL